MWLDDGRNEYLQKIICNSLIPLNIPGRGDRIRTYGLCFPKAALYQAELHPVVTVPEFNRCPRGLQ